ncbi:hypothetical protein Q7A53_16660 [Halobacillus rhizosphaerae]|uniref:hypothetical protein n=1 Tax=Halobacillus rhizosphaerae TaxID=3064889 RepID=UPI00398A97D3
MKQRIGNIGRLNLMHATEESVKAIERVNNIGTVYYRKETAHLLPLLNAGNIGSCQEIPDGYHFTKGTLFVDADYLKSITEPLKLFATNDVVIDEEVTAEQLKQSQLQLRVNGQVYTPAHLAGAAAGFISEGTTELKTYEGAQFRFEKGEFRLTNAFLKTAAKPIYLVAKGMVRFAPDLDMELLKDKLYRLDVKGVLSLYESQEPYFHQKAGSLIGSQIEVIPDGYQVIEQTLRLNSRSIRRFRGGKLYTTAPVLIDADVTREALSEALHSIHSHSIIVCHEDVEDLIYECAPLLETEVLSYQHSFIYIEDEELWTNDQLKALEQPAHFIVDGQLRFAEDVQPKIVETQIAALDNLEEVIVPQTSLKGSLQKVLRVNKGMIETDGGNKKESNLNNLGELTL